MSVRAKFVVDSVVTTKQGGAVKMVPVTSGGPENDSFFKWTPYGAIEMGLVSEETLGKFRPGDEVYVDFTPV